MPGCDSELMGLATNVTDDSEVWANHGISQRPCKSGEKAWRFHLHFLLILGCILVAELCLHFLIYLRPKV